MISVGTNLENSKQNIKIAEKYHNVFATIGIHPSEIEKHNFKSDLIELEKLSNYKKVVAIGEIGLDEKIEGMELGEQEKYLNKFIDLAVKTNLPIIFHARGKNAINTIIENISIRSNQNQKVRGVFHCFTGNLKQAQKIVMLGFKIGLTNIVCNCNDYDKLIQEIDLKNIICETDAPFIPNRKYKRKYSLPSDVENVYQKIADIKRLEIEKVTSIIYQNCLKLFMLRIID